jgi:hypothetical protein
MGFCDEYYRMTSEGRAYLEASEVKADRPGARAILGDALKRSSAARLVCGVLRGSSSAGVTNVTALLRLHGWRCRGQATEGTAVYHFLNLLSEAGLASYSRKLDRLRVIWSPDEETEPQGAAFISPSTPFSNIRRARQLVASLKGHVFWVDKHFDAKAFDVICDAAAAPRITQFTIISGPEHCTSKAKGEYGRLRQEMQSRGVSLEWRIVDGATMPTFHDRWILDGDQCWNVPPVNTIFKGQASEMLRSQSRPDIDAYLRGSASVAL